eukprot:SAG25_NODE_1063_length_4147_cov_1.725543_3_plen_321_part_00
MPADNSSACWAADDPIDQQWDRKFISLPRSLTWGPPTFIDVGGREGPEVEVEPEPEVEPAVVRGHDIWTNRQKQRRLIDAAKADQTDEVTRLLRAEGADVDGTEDGSHHGQLHRTTNLSGTTAEHTAGMTALHHAAMRNYVATMQVLVRAGAEVDKASEDGGTALMLAAELGSTHAVQYLLEQGADWQKKDNFKHTALTIAKHAGRADTAEALEAWVTDNPHGPRATIAKVPSIIRTWDLLQGEHPEDPLKASNARCDSLAKERAELLDEEAEKEEEEQARQQLEVALQKKRNEWEKAWEEGKPERKRRRLAERAKMDTS